MGYVGNEPTSNFASVTKDLFSGDGSTVAFTLSKASTTNGVAVFVENVRQEPTIAYAVSGTTLTFTAAPVTSSGNNIYVLHHNAVASTANHPAAQDLTAVKGTFTGDVSLGDSDKLILGAGSDLQLYHDGSHSYIDEVGTGSLYVRASIIRWTSADGSETLGGVGTDDGWFFKADNTTALNIDSAGHVTTPLQSTFMGTSDAGQSNIALNSAVQVVFGGTDIWDTNADFASNVFTAPVTGKYLFQVRIRMDNMPTDAAYMWTYFNSSNRVHTLELFDPDNYDGGGIYHTIQGSAIIDMDASDTCDVRIHQSGGTQQTDLDGTHFSGFLLG